MFSDYLKFAILSSTGEHAEEIISKTHGVTVLLKLETDIRLQCCAVHFFSKKEKEKMF